jgi:hypothetical protein
MPRLSWNSAKISFGNFKKASRIGAPNSDQLDALTQFAFDKNHVKHRNQSCTYFSTFYHGLKRKYVFVDTT